jgi:hypothetical protein
VEIRSDPQGEQALHECNLLFKPEESKACLSHSSDRQGAVDLPRHDPRAEGDMRPPREMRAFRGDSGNKHVAIWLFSGRVRVAERGCSSVGRAPALQAGGQRFEPAHLHQHIENRIDDIERSSVFECAVKPRAFTPKAS